MASYGHIVELAKKNMGIDIDNGFEPQYEIDADKKRVVSELKKAMKQVDQVWIATDEDREGEAIGWHVAKALWLKIDQTPRITFHEITKPALEKAIKAPRTLDMDLINAQQARRVLDRLVWFQLSPLLWKKIRTWLSAGRVQSVAVRLIVDREKEIQAFVPTPSITTSASFATPQGSFNAKLEHTFASVEETKSFLQQVATSTFSVASINAKPSKKSPSAPFTTSTLQQEASRKLGFSVSQTMRVAQKLYEAGAITYMRTDSIAMSSTAIAGASAQIKERWWEEALQVRTWVNKKASAQEAHECIRPTDFAREVAGNDSAEQKLYRLIWQRSLAAQMADAKAEKTTVKIAISQSPLHCIATGEVIKEAGFLQAYGIDPTQAKLDQDDDSSEDSDNSNQGLPILSEGQQLDLLKMISQTSYDRYPARYTEASLVKKLESEGIWRPSTYAPTISTILKREYVVLEDREGVMKNFDKLQLLPKDTAIQEWVISEEVWLFTLHQEVIQKPYGTEKKKLFPTDTGTIVTDFLIEHFPDIVDYGFTAKVEEEFDDIAEWKRDRKQMLSAFYTPFAVLIEQSWGDTVQRATGERILWNDPKTGKVVSARLGRYGAFVQLGESDDPNKQYASLKPWQRLDTLTLEEALSCFALPRNLGPYQDQDVIINIGRFGPYAKYGSMFVSLGKDNDPYTIDFETAVELIQKKQEADANKVITSFEYQNTAVSVERGRYGPFIRFGKVNIKIPKELHATITSVQQSQWEELIDAHLKNS